MKTAVPHFSLPTVDVSISPRLTEAARAFALVETSPLPGLPVPLFPFLDVRLHQITRATLTNARATSDTLMILADALAEIAPLQSPRAASATMQLVDHVRAAAPARACSNVSAVPD